MAEVEYADQEMLWEHVRDSFGQYRRKNTEYIIEQLEFMSSVNITYPDETEMQWEEDIPEQYETLVDSFGDIDQYLDYLEDGSMVVYAEQENDPLFIAHGIELSQQKNNSFKLSAISNSLSS